MQSGCPWEPAALEVILDVSLGKRRGGGGQLLHLLLQSEAENELFRVTEVTNLRVKLTQECRVCDALSLPHSMLPSHLDLDRGLCLDNFSEFL